MQKGAPKENSVWLKNDILLFLSLSGKVKQII